MKRHATKVLGERDVWSAPPFPRPVRAFAGREEELARIADLVDEDVLFLVYGVAGIGKSELVYRVIQEMRATDKWRDATPLLVDVRPDATVSRTLAQLLAATGASVDPHRGQRTEHEHHGEQLVALATALQAHPYLLFFDDAHHLPAQPVAEALSYLARHVQTSRLFVTSRQEIDLRADSPPPVVTTLSPLNETATAELIAALSERLQVARPNSTDIFRTTRGSPFHIRQMMARHGPAADSLEESLAELKPAARAMLLAAAIAQHRPQVQTLRRTWSSPSDFTLTLRDLERRFLVDVVRDAVVVHDLIREALTRQVTPTDLAAAHASAAAMCVDQLHHDTPPALINVVNAVHHYSLANEHAQAWALLGKWHSALSGAGTDDLLMELLERLREALPNQRVAIDLMIARGLVRASMIEQASAILDRVDEQRSIDEEWLYCALAGETAQRAGQLARAEQMFERALAGATNETARYQARVRIAGVAMFSGDGGRARQSLDAALAELDTPSPRRLARCSWARTVSLIIDEQFEAAATEARTTRQDIDGAGFDDLSNLLVMLETLACIECDDMPGARIAVKLIDEDGLRNPVASMYRAIAAYADGEPRRASTALQQAHIYLSDHGDTINAYLAGYYGSAALAEIGQLGDASALMQRVTNLARAAGLDSLVAQSLAKQALLAAEAVQAPVAHRLAAEALAAKFIGPRSRATCHCAHAHAYTIEGDISAALEHIALARAAVAGLDLVAAEASTDLENAAVDLIGGNLQRAVELAENAAAHYSKGSRDYESARAQLVLAAVYVARGRRSDTVLGEQSIAAAAELANRGELRSIQVGCAILSAALARRENREKAATELLADALRTLGPERGSLYASTLLTAIEGGAAAGAIPGAVALLAHLGLADAVDCYIVDQHGRRAATERDVARERLVRELVVDEVRSVIVACEGTVEITGRPMQCELLSVIVQARGAPVAAEVLYKRVWGVTEYHPLQHRNALYVAINRLRKSLRKTLGDREFVERANKGWRLAKGVNACAIVAVRSRSK